MNPLVNYFLAAWPRSFDYTGRSTRAEFWWFNLAYYILSLLFYFLSGVSEFFFKLLTFFWFASIVPSLPLTIRRLRDAGKTWPWIFIAFIPLIGGIWLIVLLCQPSAVSPVL